MQLPLAASEDVFKLLSQLAILFLFIALPILQRTREKKREAERRVRRGRPATPTREERAAERREAEEMWRRLLGGEPEEPAPRPGPPRAQASAAPPARQAPPPAPAPTVLEGPVREEAFPQRSLEEAFEPWAPAPEALGETPTSVFEKPGMALPSDLAPVEKEIGALPAIELGPGLGTAPLATLPRALPDSLGALARGGPAARSRGRPTSAFLRGLRRPADWRSAVVLAEVLGPPRSMGGLGGHAGGFGAPPGLG